MALQEFGLSNGSELVGEWNLPDPKLFTDKTHPVAVLIPSHSMKDVEGNGSSLSVRSQLRDLAQAFNSVGFATFRFAPKQESQSLGLAEELEALEKAFEHPAVDGNHTILVGIADAADRIAKNYYDYFRVHAPAAAVLLSPSVSALHLNNLTCPYLLIHGADDPLLKEMSYQRFESAVHHHEIRYGDVTTSKLFLGVGRELGREAMDRRVLNEVRKWVGPLRYASANRRQESVAA